MLNARQVQILLLLWNQDYSGDYLARKVDSSRRTIIRDITTLNQVLSADKIATIDSTGKYSLIIQNYPKFQSLIHQFEDEDRKIVYYLLINDSLSIDELMEKTFLSKNDVLNSIERINQREKDTLHISSRIGIGYLLTLNFGTKTDLLAYIISVMPEEEKKSLNHSQIPDELRNYITDNQLASQMTAISLIYPASPAEFYQQKLNLINEITFSNIQNNIEEVSKKFSIKLSKKDLSEKITLHLRRYNLFPTFISSLLSKQMNDLKLKEPFAFDMAYDLRKEIIKNHPNVLINSDYLALYIINCMETETTVKKVKILMFTFQRSIAYINENIIFEAVKNIQLTSIFNLTEFNQRAKTRGYDIIITNGFSDDIKCTPDLIIDGIIDESTTIHLKKLVSDNYIHKNLTQMFPEENYMEFDNESSNYFKAIKKILKEFTAKNLLTPELSEQLLDREEAGNQLIINHVAIPHSVSGMNMSKIFAVGLNEPLKLNDSEIYFIVIVAVNDKNDDYKQIFNYLYKILSNKQIKSTNNFESYASIMDVLNK